MEKEISTPQAEVIPAPEKLKAKFSVFFTDHFADLLSEPHRYPAGIDFSNLFKRLRKEGFDSRRADWRWKNISLEKYQINTAYLENAANLCQMAKDNGLDNVIILHDAPGWAKKLLAEGKDEEFLEAFTAYAQSVKDTLAVKGIPIHKIQIFNEFNVGIYTPRKVLPLIPELCEITKEIFGPDIELSGTLLVGNISETPGKIRAVFLPINTFFDGEYKSCLEVLDTVSLDYYPGFWHQPKEDLMRFDFQNMPKNLVMLEEAIRKVAALGKKVEIGETGLPTFERRFGYLPGERQQRWWFDNFARAFREMRSRLKQDGINIQALGIYQALDENELGGLPKFGVYTGTGEQKAITSSRQKKGFFRPPSPISQLQTVIDYLKHHS